MKTSFTFNSRTSPYATVNVEENRMFISHMENHINDLIKYRGYVYLNQIYEMFGVEWNTEWENLCLTRGDITHRIVFAVARSNEDGFDIDIL